MYVLTFLFRSVDQRRTQHRTAQHITQMNEMNVVWFSGGHNGSVSHLDIRALTPPVTTYAVPFMAEAQER
jgi:hypothetical protein